MFRLFRITCNILQDEILCVVWSTKFYINICSVLNHYGVKSTLNLEDETYLWYIKT